MFGLTPEPAVAGDSAGDSAGVREARQVIPSARWKRFSAATVVVCVLTGVYGAIPAGCVLFLVDHVNPTGYFSVPQKLTAWTMLGLLAVGPPLTLFVAVRLRKRPSVLASTFGVTVFNWKTVTIPWPDAGGRTFTLKKVRQSSWPGIAETISRDSPNVPAHTLKRQTGKKDPLLRQLLDETGTPILYTAAGSIKFPGHRWLRFPLRGTTQANAIMTAVDQAGNKVARYRLVRNKNSWRRVEIIVHPGQQLTDELALALALSAPLLRSHFHSGGGGGG